MISMETARRIWHCYREIATAQKLLAQLEQAIREGKVPDPLDDFDRHRCFQLGVPSGHDCQRLFDVQPTMAMSVIRAHIAAKQAELVEANEQARLQLV
jgi:hypothetical protein